MGWQVETAAWLPFALSRDPQAPLSGELCQAASSSLRSAEGDVLGAEPLLSDCDKLLERLISYLAEELDLSG